MVRDAKGDCLGVNTQKAIRVDKATPTQVDGQILVREEAPKHLGLPMSQTICRRLLRLYVTYVEHLDNKTGCLAD